MFGIGALTSTLFVPTRKSEKKDDSLKSGQKKVRLELSQARKTGQPVPANNGTTQDSKQKTLEKDESASDDAETLLARNLPVAGLGTISALLAFVNPVFFVPAAVISGYLTVPLFKDGLRKYRKHRQIVDLLDSMLIPVMIGFNQLFAATLILFSMSVSRRVLSKTYDRSRQSLQCTLSSLPKHVWVIMDGVEVECEYRELKRGSIVVVSSGELVPVDGTVTQGEALIDQKILTGESVPVEKTVNDSVFAGTWLLSGRLFVKVEQSGEDTHTNEVSRLILNAADHRTAVQERGAVVAERSLPVLLGISVSTAVFHSISRALSVYLVTPGYTMRLLAPLALLKTLQHSTNQGILVKDGRSIELLKNVDTVIFDKTGTLTDGALKVADVVSCADFDSQAILSAAARAESCQTHPIARAIIEAARKANISTRALKESQYTVGRGVCAQVDGHKVLVGSFLFLSDEGYDIPQTIREQAEEFEQNGFISILVAIDESVAGFIALDQVIRSGTRQLIADLHGRGIKTAIISGDTHTATKHLAEKLGIDSFYSETLPDEKYKIIKRMQGDGHHVCFVGDGVNDAAALKQANVSISISGSSTIALDTAQIVLVSVDLSLINKLFEISENYQDIGGFTERIAIGLPLAVLPAVVFGLAGSVLVIAAHNISIWGGLWRILRKPNPVNKPQK